MNAEQWVQFALELEPFVEQLLRALFERHQGDASAAKAELMRIPDHWTGLAAVEADVDARIDAVAKQQGKP